MKSTLPWIKLGLVSGCIAAAIAPAHAGLLDSLFGKSNKSSDANEVRANPKQRAWYLREFTTIELAPREPGSPANQHPIQLQPEALRQQLLLIRKHDASGNETPLFDDDEAAELALPLAQAFSNAAAGDDVQLLTSARRNGVFGPPRAITARLFIQGDALNLIVHDVENDFVINYRQTGRKPEFSYGSRGAATPRVALQSRAATNRRDDWLSFPLRGEVQQAATPSAPAAPAAAAAPTLLQTTPPAPPPSLTAAPPVPALTAAPAAVAPTAAAPAAPARPAVAPAAVVAPVPVAPTAAPAAPQKPNEPASADDAERRLQTLKRLRDRNLITEEEYQQKRKEVLQTL